jgi:membrane-associated phospholipid phosphatase
MRRNRARKSWLFLLCSLLLAGITITASAQIVSGPIEPRAGTWKTWVLASGSELRLPAPPDAETTKAELAEIRSLAVKRDSAALTRIRYWDAGSPAYRWNEIAIEASVRNNISSTLGARAFALLAVTIDDALIAAWDSKYTYNRPRPSEVDSKLPTVVPTPRSPSYPSEHAVVAGAASTVLAYLWPKEEKRFVEQAEEAARSRVLAGMQYPSDVKAGLELGRAVAARTIERAKSDGTGIKWTGTIPTGRGLWTGTNPGGVEEAALKTWVLSSASEVRPGPPPAHDSSQRATELAEVKAFKRTPMTNGLVQYTQYGRYGTPGTHILWNREVSRKLFEERLDANPPRSARLYALVNVANYDAVIASQDAKFTYWTARPNQFDPTITTVIPNPNFPTYPSNAAAFMTAPALVMAYFFPLEAVYFDGLAKQFGESRLWAGIHFRSDIDAGYAIGRAVGQKVIERAKAEGAQ